MRMIATGMLLVLGVASCVHNASTDDKRWARLNGREVFLVKGYDKVVHANPECPVLKAAKGTVIPCKVKHGRLMDESGIYQNGPEEVLPLCGSCVE